MGDLTFTLNPETLNPKPGNNKLYHKSENSEPCDLNPYTWLMICCIWQEEVQRPEPHNLNEPKR